MRGWSATRPLTTKRSTGFDECAVPQIAERLLKLRGRIHHDRSVPRDRLLDRTSGHQQEADAFVARLHDPLVAAIEEHERPVLRLLRNTAPRHAIGLLGQHTLRSEERV